MREGSNSRGMRHSKLNLCNHWQVLTLGIKGSVGVCRSMKGSLSTTVAHDSPMLWLYMPV